MSKDRLVPCRNSCGANFNIFRSHCGAILVEFAIAANIIIMINIFAYDYASYFRLSERAKHATQFIEAIFTNDTDHRLTLADLDQSLNYLRWVTGEQDFSNHGALTLMDVMPYYDPSSAKWNFLVCWSWSSNPMLGSPPAIGSLLSPSDYRFDAWVPKSGLAAGSALLVVKSQIQNDLLFNMSPVPNLVTVVMMGPIRYAANLPINLMLYNNLGGVSLNESKTRDPNLSNAIVCQR